MKVLSVCGITRSGKTTTMLKIIEGLRVRGYRVAAVKDIPFGQFRLDDAPGSGTRLYQEAGAGLVAVRSDEETALLYPGKLPVERLIAFFEGECDYLLLEGVEELDVPVIVTAHTREDLAARWSKHAICVSGRISSRIEGYQGKPALSALDRLDTLLDLIERECARHP